MKVRKGNMVFDIDRSNKVRLIYVAGIPVWGKIGKYRSQSKALRKVVAIGAMGEDEQNKYFDSVFVSVHPTLLPILIKRLDTKEKLTAKEEETLKGFTSYVAVRLQHYKVIGANGFTSASFIFKSHARKLIQALRGKADEYQIVESMTRYHKINMVDYEEYKDLITELPCIPTESREGTEWIRGIGTGLHQRLGSATHRTWDQVYIFDTGKIGKRPQVQTKLNQLTK